MICTRRCATRTCWRTARPRQGPANLGISDPLHYGATVPPGADPTRGARDHRDRQQHQEPDPQSADHQRYLPVPGAGDRPWHAPHGGLRPAWCSLASRHHGDHYRRARRTPVKPLLREMLDRVAAAPGEGRYTPENFEEAVRKYARGWTNRFAKILASAPATRIADAMSDEDGDMLRHLTLTTGETPLPVDPNPDGTGPSKPIPEHLLTAAGRLRQLMDEVWRCHP